MDPPSKDSTVVLHPSSLSVALAPWRSSLARALHRNRSLVYARYAQLSTVQANGRPANRTIVFRGFLNDANTLKFVTDARSQKAEHIDRSPWGELCWYFPKTREQFRFAGLLTLVREDHPDPTLQAVRQVTWQELSEAARTQFAWDYPGEPRLDNTSFEVPPPEASTPLSQFCLLLLAPDRVDHLELRGTPQNRYVYVYDDSQWSIQEVNP